MSVASKSEMNDAVGERSEPHQVQLVRMGPEHLDATCRWLASSEALRLQIDSGGAPTPEGNASYWQANWANKSRRDFAIIAGGKHIGNCGLSSVDLARKKAELWIYLGQAYGTGAGSAAVRLLLAHGFDELSLHRIYLRVVADNPRAVPFYERLGFVVEGRFREDTRRPTGFIDSTCLAILAPEYRHAQADGR